MTYFRSSKLTMMNLLFMHDRNRQVWSVICFNIHLGTKSTTTGPKTTMMTMTPPVPMKEQPDLTKIIIGASCGSTFRFGACCNSDFSDYLKVKRGGKEDKNCKELAFHSQGNCGLWTIFWRKGPHTRSAYVWDVPLCYGAHWTARTATCWVCHIRPPYRVLWWGGARVLRMCLQCNCRE